MGRFKELDIEQQEAAFIHAVHATEKMKGRTIRTLEDAIYDLSTARDALRNGRTEVVAERIEFLIDEFNALIEDLEHEQD